jgi:type II secretion system protein N
MRWGRTVVVAIGVGILAFLLGCFLFFPTAALKDRLVYEVNSKTPVRLTVDNLTLRFPLGVSARGVTVQAPQLPEDLEIAWAGVSPVWLSLFGANPAAAVDGALLGGEVDAVVHRKGGFSARGRDLELDLPLSATSKLHLSGVLRQAEVEGAFPLQAETESHADLTVENLVITGMKAVGAGRDRLPLGTLTLTASGNGNTFRLESMQTRGGELALEGSGSLLLANPVPRSRINLSLVLRPADNFDPALKDLLGMVAKPARDGSLRLRLTGSLAAPNLQ